MTVKIHITPHKNGGWQVKKESNAIATVVSPTKTAAVSYGKIVAKKENSTLYIHRKDGKVQNGISYRVK